MVEIDESMLDDLYADARRKRAALEALLDEQSAKSDPLAFRAHMGDTVSYVTSVPLEWFATGVYYAHDLPVLPSGHNADVHQAGIDAGADHALPLLEPDWPRQLELVRYLATSPHRRFPPMMLAAAADWVYDRYADQWCDGFALEDSIRARPLDSEGAYVSLHCENVSFYSLSGQHTLLTIHGLIQLLNHGVVSGMDAEGNPVSNKSLRLDDITQEVPKAKLRAILKESMGVEIVPAVMHRETFEKAALRMHNLLVHAGY